MQRIIPLVLVSIIAGTTLGGCAGGGSSISETTKEFPKCDVPAGKVSVDTLICTHSPCREHEKTLMSWKHQYGGDNVFQHIARSKGFEGNTMYGLYDAHDKLSHQLINALRETGCFTSVELKTSDKDSDADWRVSGELNKVYAGTSGSRNEVLNQATRTNTQTQKAGAILTVAVHKGEAPAVLEQRKFDVSAKRVGERESNFSGFDWTRKRDEEDFGDTAMQDVATEIVLEAASFITEKTAGVRITHRVTLPVGKQSAQNGQDESLTGTDKK